MPDYDKAKPDEVYRELHRRGQIPAKIRCPRPGCPFMASFQNDLLAARYECNNQHSTAAMHVDEEVFGEEAYK